MGIFEGECVGCCLRDEPSTLTGSFHGMMSGNPQSLELLMHNIYFFIILQPNPATAGQHVSCHEMSYSKREVKLKKEKKTENFPFIPFKL